MANDLLETLSTEQPCLVKCADFARSISENIESVENQFEKLLKSSREKPIEDRVNLVFLVSGKLQSNQGSCLTVANQCDLNAVKSKYNDDARSSMYGIYKGDTLPVYKLQSYKFSSLTSPRISLKSDTARNCNAKRVANQASGSNLKPEHKKSLTDSNPTMASSSSSSKPSANVASFFSKKLDNTKEQERKSNVKRETLQPKQNRLNFTSAKQMEPSNSASRNATIKEDSEEAVNISKAESKSLKVDESNEVTTSKPRQRVRMMSDSSSDEDISVKSERSNNIKNKPESSESERVKPEPKLKGTTLLDPDDIQFESDEDVDKRMANDLNEDKQSEDRPKSKRRKRKTEDDEQEETTSNSKKSKTPNFGKVISGETCGRMKYVDKTWMDDDGFLVTEKVLEEDTTPKPPPSPPKPDVLKETSQKQKLDSAPVTKKRAKPVSAHQSSITSFFKKK